MMFLQLQVFVGLIGGMWKRQFSFFFGISPFHIELQNYKGGEFTLGSIW